MAVYLLHLASPLAHAQHYIGFAGNVQARLAHHHNGTGSRFCQVCNERGIDYVIARIWPDGDKTFERRLKNYKKSSSLCPICSGDSAKKRME